MEYAIQVENLSKTYGDVRAVQDLSFAVKRGTVFGLLGANGAGKSTTLECILGTRRPEGGKETSRPPTLSPGHPCYGCGNYRDGQPCVGFCHRQLTAWLRERRMKNHEAGDR